MSETKVAGGRHFLPTVEQRWTPEMASAEPLCTQPVKQTYATRRQATEAAKAIRRNGGRKLDPYECSCGKFHLTKHRRT